MPESDLAKYSSRVMPAERRLLLIMNTGTSGQSGITMGLITPFFVYTKWSPSVLTQLNPAFSKTLLSFLAGIGVILDFKLQASNDISSVATKRGVIQLFTSVFS